MYITHIVSYHFQNKCIDVSDTYRIRYTNHIKYAYHIKYTYRIYTS